MSESMNVRPATVNESMNQRSETMNDPMIPWQESTGIPVIPAATAEAAPDFALADSEGGRAALPRPPITACAGSGVTRARCGSGSTKRTVRPT